MIKHCQTWILILAAASLVHCGTSVDLPFDDDKQVKDLTGSELKELCTVGLEAFEDSYGEDVCSLQGIMASLQGETTCEAKRDECMAEMFNSANCNSNDEPEPMQCEITVGEMETCMNDTLDQIEELPSFDCSMTMQDLMAIDQTGLDFSPASSCQKLDQGCEDLNMGMGGGVSVDDDSPM